VVERGPQHAPERPPPPAEGEPKQRPGREVAQHAPCAEPSGEQVQPQHLEVEAWQGQARGRDRVHQVEQAPVAGRQRGLGLVEQPRADERRLDREADDGRREPPGALGDTGEVLARRVCRDDEADEHGDAEPLERAHRALVVGVRAALADRPQALVVVPVEAEVDVAQPDPRPALEHVEVSQRGVRARDQDEALAQAGGLDGVGQLEQRPRIVQRLEVDEHDRRLVQRPQLLDDLGDRPRPERLVALAHRAEAAGVAAPERVQDEGCAVDPGEAVAPARRAEDRAIGDVHGADRVRPARRRPPRAVPAGEQQAGHVREVAAALPGVQRLGDEPAQRRQVGDRGERVGERVREVQRALDDVLVAVLGLGVQQDPRARGEGAHAPERRVERAGVARVHRDDGRVGDEAVERALEIGLEAHVHEAQLVAAQRRRQEDRGERLDEQELDHVRGTGGGRTQQQDVHRGSSCGGARLGAPLPRYRGRANMYEVNLGNTCDTQHV